ncbi:hypothetical protein AGMMS49579_20310 [Spirochaetia bacterium]|nr:hypothetical protein AGMMS49579_20310 [Spirochaetia bacterium]
MLVNKILRSLDAVELVDSGSVIDAANHAEKRGIITAESIPDSFTRPFRYRSPVGQLKNL